MIHFSLSLCFFKVKHSLESVNFKGENETNWVLKSQFASWRRPHELEKSLFAVSSRKPLGSVGSAAVGSTSIGSASVGEASRVLEGAHLICRPSSCRVVEVVRQEGVDQEGGRGPRGRCYTSGGQVWSLTNFFHNFLGSLKKMDPLS